jgi:aspartate kinase
MSGGEFMRILVQKFGGTSLSTSQARAHVIEHIQDALADEYRLVVVVSAIGRKGDPYATDTLLGLIEQVKGRLPAREKDMLLCCGEVISASVLCSVLHAQSIPAVVLTGAQAGIMTNERFGNAQIQSIRPERIFKLLKDNRVVIVTGFQGINEHNDWTTLGRGGSDTSATALGAALHAEFVDIFTDVEGVLTADPRIVEDAKPLASVGYAEICNMAYQGAKVIHPRAVELAMQANIPIRVRSTFSRNPGTLVSSSDRFGGGFISDRHVTGIAHAPHVTQIRVSTRVTGGFGSDSEYVNPGNTFDLQLKVFKAMAQNDISVDFINVNPSGIIYTVFDSDATHAVNILRQMNLEPEFMNNCAKVSVIGGGMNGVPGIMARIVEALTANDVQILQSADSNASIWVLVKYEDMVKSVRALHRAFQLNK